MGKIHGTCDNGGFFCKEVEERHRQCHSDMETDTATGVGRATKCPQESQEKKAHPGHRTAEPGTVNRS